MSVSIEDQIRSQFQLRPIALHVTRIENLDSIISNGGIHSKNGMADLSFTDLSNGNVQMIRANKIIPVTSRTIHDYVPFYFTFKTPMLAAIQQDAPSLIYIQIKLDIFSRIPNVVISDGNCASANTQFKLFSEVSDLAILDLSILQKSVRYANDPEKKRRKAAELLIPDFLGINEIDCLVVAEEATRIKTLQILDKFGINLTVKTIPGWFFGYSF